MQGVNKVNNFTDIFKLQTKGSYGYKENKEKESLLRFWF